MKRATDLDFVNLRQVECCNCGTDISNNFIPSKFAKILGKAVFSSFFPTLGTKSHQKWLL